jgi:hypothetical protein
MKKFYFSICLSFTLFNLQAQTKLPITSTKDKIDYRGYTIKILPVMGGTYGYNVLKGKELIIHQFRNPFSMSRLGLRKKQDVLKVAQWQINQLQSNKATLQRPLANRNNRHASSELKLRKPAIINQSLPKEVAHDLQIGTQ